MPKVLRQIIRDNRAGKPVAIPSVCSAQPDVLRASLRRAKTLGQSVVIEATSNQVNQDGGYTGMRAADFVRFVHKIADQVGIDRGQVIFGGDHLGPQAWRSLPADQAMAKAKVLVRDYVASGIAKIHLDCSEGCAGEAAQLDDAQTAERSAQLARICAETSDDLLFVVGTEVPPPGGARSDEHEDIAPTQPAAAAATLAAHGDTFGDLAPLIGGLVVQPGVEFAPMHVHHLPMDRDPGLLAALDDWPGVCLEAHSTDYQHPAAYPRLATLGFAFQKVGPALTFAYRQALYALDCALTMAGRGTGLRAAMEQVMLDTPSAWQGHYHGDAADLAVQRHFGLADRIRYYWPADKAQTAVRTLLTEAAKGLPDPLLWQVFGTPVLDRADTLEGDRTTALIDAQIQLALDPYFLNKTTQSGRAAA